jgi:phage terminase large subunit
MENFAESTLEAFVEAAAGAGCPPDQAENFLRRGIILQPRQLAASSAARECDQAQGPTDVGYGGARGGGKSHWLLAQMGADDCQRVAGLKCLLLRKVGKANMENFEDLKQRLFRHTKHTFTRHRGLLEFPNGSRIIAGHFQTEGDIDSYLGLEYDVIGIEEATTLTYRKFTDISTCCRTSKPNWRPRTYSTTNPGGVGHAWYRKKFIVPFQKGQETETRFISARVSDNVHNNPEYARKLESLHGWQRRAWLDGDWDIAAGQYFTNFRREVHAIKSFDVRTAREWFAALDYGFTHYTVVLLGCKDGDGNVYVVDEHAERQWLPARHAEAVTVMLARYGLGLHSLSRFVAGTDVFSKKQDGSTVAGDYKNFGINLKAASTDRINGWAEVLKRLGDPDSGIRPKLFIHERCTRTLETLPAMQHDPNRPEDVLKVDCDEEGNGGDDAADCLRYLVHYQPRLAKQAKLRGF